MPSSGLRGSRGPVVAPRNCAFSGLTLSPERNESNASHKGEANSLSAYGMSYYRPDLAAIHDDGFSELASGGAEVLVAGLDRSGLHRGTVLDFGCGSGITARHLADRGYSVTGIDLSESLIEIARKRVPEATFQVGSFVEMDMPSSVAICAIGEVLNYTFDKRNTSATREAFLTRAFRALAPGGVLLCDVAGPDRAPDCPTRTFTEGQNWTVLVETSAEASVLTRRIVTFRRNGSLYQRDAEVHRLQLIAPDEIESTLRSIGFGVERLDGYGVRPFPRGLYGFLALRPPSTA
jgi:SAM-dependent methyltransferase